MDIRYSMFCTNENSIYGSFLNERYRTVLTRWRLSSIDINIETGRYKHIPRHDRICNCCTSNEIEDENHVIFECSAYNEIRVSYDILTCYSSVKSVLNPKSNVEACNVAAYLLDIEKTREKHLSTRVI